MSGLSRGSATRGEFEGLEWLLRLCSSLGGRLSVTDLYFRCEGLGFDRLPRFLGALGSAPAGATSRFIAFSGRGGNVYFFGEVRRSGERLMGWLHVEYSYDVDEDVVVVRGGRGEVRATVTITLRDSVGGVVEGDSLGAVAERLLRMAEEAKTMVERMEAERRRLEEEAKKLAGCVAGCRRAVMG